MKTTDTIGKYPMGALEMLEYLESVGRCFRELYFDNSNNIIKVDQETVDAIIVDFINHVAYSQCIDYALTAESFRKSDRNQNRHWYLHFALLKDIVWKNARSYKANRVIKVISSENIKGKIDEEKAKSIIDNMVGYICCELI